MSPLAGLKNLRWVLLLPRLRRGLNDCARFAGFPATTDFRLTPMRPTPWATLCRPSGPKMLAGLRNVETPVRRLHPRLLVVCPGAMPPSCPSRTWPVGVRDVKVSAAEGHFDGF
jgi:hypothetical protein